MYEYLPGNYVCNLGVVAALNSGGLTDEIDRVPADPGCRRKG
jgi:hypothetical protein